MALFKKSLGAVDAHEEEEPEAVPLKMKKARDLGDQEDGGSLLKKKKWTADSNFAGEPAAEPVQQEDDAEKKRALQQWVEREREENERAERKANMKLRARLLGFHYIDKNKMSRSLRKLHYEDEATCQCEERGHDCSDTTCVNYTSKTECTASRCGADCKNQRFQKKEWIEISLVKRGRMGYGARTEQDVQKGQFVMEYVGEVIDEEEKYTRLSEGGARHHYTMALGGTGEYIDPSRYGNFARFLNHSCDPNCETQMWDVLGEQRMGFFAKRFIPKGEDLTFNYQFKRSGITAQKCLCGAANCVGWLGLKREGGAGSGSEESESIKEQSFDSNDADDPLGLVEDGNAVRPWEKLTKKQKERMKNVDASLFLITADLIQPLMRSAKKDVQKNSRHVRSHLFLPRNIRRGFATFYQFMELDLPYSAVLDEINREKQYRKGSSSKCLFEHSPDAREAIETLVRPLIRERPAHAPIQNKEEPTDDHEPADSVQEKGPVPDVADDEDDKGAAE